MPYDFDRLTDRRQSHSMKWDVPEQELPMWVADMDFETHSAGDLERGCNRLVGTAP